MALKFLRPIMDGLSGPTSLSVSGFLAITPLLILRGLEFQLPYLHGDLAGAFGATAAATLTTGAILVLASITLLRNRRAVSGNPFLTLAVYLVAGAAGSIIGLISATNSGLPERETPTAILIESTLFTVLWLTASATVTGAAYRSRSTARQLTDELSRLRAVRDQSQEVLGQYHAELAQTLDDQTRPQLAELLDVTTGLLATPEVSSVDAATLVGQLRQATAEVFKPVGRALGSTQSTPVIPVVRNDSAPPRRGRLGLRQAARLAFTRDAIAPWQVALLSTGVSLLAAPRPAYLLPYIAVGAVLLVASLSVIKRVTPQSVWRRRLPVRILVVCGTYGLAGAVSVLAAPVVKLYVFHTPPQVFQAEMDWGLWTFLLGFSTMICGIVWAIGSAMTLRLRQQQRDLQAAVATTSWELEQLQGRVEATRRAIAHLVHTDIQGCAAGCAMVLEFALQSSQTPDGLTPGSAAQLRSALTQTQRRLADTLDALDTALGDRSQADQLDVASGLATLVTTWSGFIAVTVESNPLALVRLSERPAAAQVVVELVGEALANAAVHGAARHVDVHIGLSEQSIEVRVRDDGQGLAPGARPGGGSAAIERSTSSWSLSQVISGGCELRATIPVGDAG